MPGGLYIPLGWALIVPVPGPGGSAMVTQLSRLPFWSIYLALEEHVEASAVQNVVTWVIKGMQSSTYD